jgi:hypothetical protein
MPTKDITDDRYIDICQCCITAITDKFTYTSNLFDMMAPLTEVREVFQSNHLGLLSQFGDINDAHMIVGILTQSLKEMKLPCLYEIYDDILTTVVDDDVTHCINVIRSWIIKLPIARFELFKSLLQVLQRLLNCSAEYNEPNLSYILGIYLSIYHLYLPSYLTIPLCLAPFLCRPVNSVFMSIRHMNDLNRYLSIYLLIYLLISIYIFCFI